MNSSIIEILHSYLRELSVRRVSFVLCFYLIASVALVVSLSWPKNYTATSTIYADNSNILRPLMEGTAITTGIVDQARMAQEILFKRDYTSEVLETAGFNVRSLTQEQQDNLIEGVQGRTSVLNVGRGPTSLIRIEHTDADPVKAFRIVQKYTSLFIQESVVAKQAESRNAFNFIQAQVLSYQDKLQESEARLSKFKSENNNGTLVSANNRIDDHRAEIEKMELNLMQLNVQKASVEAKLAGEGQVSQDLSEVNAMRARINFLQVRLDDLRSRFQETYPDVVQVKKQIADLREILESGRFGDYAAEELDVDAGVTPLYQELRSQLSTIDTAQQSTAIQLGGVERLLELELERTVLINSSEAELAELTRDYNVTRDFYNDMLMRLENARVSMNLDEAQQGVTFKVQESAVVPTKPDGITFPQLLIGSFVLALAVPIGLLILYMEFDPRIKSESDWKEEWPPLLMTVPPLKSLTRRRISNPVFAVMAIVVTLAGYGMVVELNTGFFRSMASSILS